MKRAIIFLVVGILFVGSLMRECNGAEKASKTYQRLITISETNGLTRVNEPVDIVIDFIPSRCDPTSIRLTSRPAGEVPVQVGKEQIDPATGKKSFEIIFLANVEANKKADYYLSYGPEKKTFPDYTGSYTLKVSDEKDYVTVENKYIKCELAKVPCKVLPGANTPIASGYLSGVFFKDKPEENLIDHIQTTAHLRGSPDELPSCPWTQLKSYEIISKGPLKVTVRMICQGSIAGIYDEYSLYPEQKYLLKGNYLLNTGTNPGLFCSRLVSGVALMPELSKTKLIKNSHFTAQICPENNRSWYVVSKSLYLQDSINIQNKPSTYKGMKGYAYLMAIAPELSLKPGKKSPYCEAAIGFDIGDVAVVRAAVKKLVNPIEVTINAETEEK